MPAVQSNYAEFIGEAYHGMVANLEATEIVSRTAVGADLALGASVKRNGDHGCEVIAAGGDTFFGIVVRDQSAALASDGSADVIPEDDTAGLLRSGVVFVTANGAVTAGATVYFDPTDGSYTATSTDNAALPATFDRAAADGELVPIRVISAAA